MFLKVFSTCSEECLEAEFSSRKIYICFLCLGFKYEKLVFCCSSFERFWTISQKITFLAKIFQQSYQNCILRGNTKYLKKKLFFGKSINFYHFRSLGENDLIIDGKVFNSTSTVHSTYPGNVSRKFATSNIFKFFWNCWDLGEKNRTSSKIFPAGLSELLSTCPEDHFKRDNFIGWIIF